MAWSCCTRPHRLHPLLCRLASLAATTSTHHPVSQKLERRMPGGHPRIGHCKCKVSLARDWRQHLQRCNRAGKPSPGTPCMRSICWQTSSQIPFLNSSRMLTIWCRVIRPFSIALNSIASKIVSLTTSACSLTFTNVIWQSSRSEVIKFSCATWGDACSLRQWITRLNSDFLFQANK